MIDQKKFSELKSKYNIPQKNNLSNSHFLYLILAKADINITFLNEIDWEWLSKNFSKTYELLQNNQKIQEKKINSLAEDFKPIYAEYNFIFANTTSVFKKPSNNFQDVIKSITSELSSILLKIGNENDLSKVDISYLKNESLNGEKYNQLKDFLRLKKLYNIVDDTNLLSHSSLYKILKKIENEQELTEKELSFMSQHTILHNILTNYNSQQKRYVEEFSQLKDKYCCSHYADNSYKSSPLYKILKKLELGNNLTDQEIKWLDNNKLQDTSEIANFLSLKIKYQVEDHQDLSTKSHLYKVLKNINSINPNTPLSEQDINFLKKRNLLNLINVANQKYANCLIKQISQGIELNNIQSEWAEKNPKFNIAKLMTMKDFNRLTKKYQISIDDQLDKLFDNQLYLILKNLEKGKLLEATEIVYLKDKDLFYPDTTIYISYHSIEALSYEDNYKKTGNKWNLPNISSAWRKANQPDKALKTTENINFEQIKENKLKSAILTTRGGSFRDIFHLDEAEKCARQAIKFQPESHHPYTLMGAICYDRYDYNNGDQWFAKAIERGASTQSIDSEIKKSMARMKDIEKRKQVAEELIKKDPERYAWAKQYLKQPNPKKVKQPNPKKGKK